MPQLFAVELEDGRRFIASVGTKIDEEKIRHAIVHALGVERPVKCINEIWRRKSNWHPDVKLFEVKGVMT